MDACDPDQPGSGAARAGPAAGYRRYMRDRDTVLAACSDHVYGAVPPGLPAATALAMAPVAIPGGTLSEWRLAFADGLPPVWLLLALPERRPAPCLVGLNFAGNHLAHRSAGIRVTDRWVINDHGNRADPSERGARAAMWSLETAVARGWAVATACCADFQEDRPDGLGLLRSWQGRWNAGAIAAWAWGLSRLADWLCARPEIDATRLVVCGHSRLGKTALLAGARDPRFAMVIPSQSGTGGVAPSLDPSPGGESVERITSVFPHWFVPGYATQTAIEQHELLATIAPRPVLVTNAADDAWASPAGQWRSLQRAAPAWGVQPPALPPPLRQRLRGPLGWWMREGKHAQTADEIAVWLDAADEALEKLA